MNLRIVLIIVIAIFVAGCVQLKPDSESGDSPALSRQTAIPKEERIQRILPSELKPLKGGMPGEQGLEREIMMAPGVKLAATIEVTAKGNGAMRIGSLNLRVFDSHDDGEYYENGLLDIEFPDMNGDGRRQMVVSGIVCFTDEKEDRVLRREHVVYIYAFQPDGKFKEVYRNTKFRIDM